AAGALIQEKVLPVGGSSRTRAKPCSASALTSCRALFKAVVAFQKIRPKAARAIPKGTIAAIRISFRRLVLFEDLQLLETCIRASTLAGFPDTRAVFARGGVQGVPDPTSVGS